MSTTETQATEAIPQSLDTLASLLENREHLLALDGDAQLAEGARAATKDIFDHGMFAGLQLVFHTQSFESLRA